MNPASEPGILKDAGCDQIVQDEAVIEGGKLVRKRLERTLVDLNIGDVLVVERLDALGELMPYVVKSLQSLAERGVEFMSIRDGIDTAKDGGAFYGFIEALSRFEKTTRARKVKRGMAAASRHGRKLGAPRKLTELQEIELRRAYRKGKETVGSLALKYEISTQTVYRLLDETGERS